MSFVSSGSATHAAPTALRLGWAGAPAMRRLSRPLLALSRRWPDMDIGVQERSRAALIAQVRDGSIDLAVMGGDRPAHGATCHVAAEPVMVALHRRHPLAGHAAIQMVVLEDELLLAPRNDAQADFSRLLTRTVLGARIAPRRLVDVDGDAALLRRVAAGEGVALVAGTVAATDGVALVAIAGGITIDLWALWADDSSCPATAMLAELLARDRPDGSPVSPAPPR